MKIVLTSTRWKTSFRSMPVQLWEGVTEEGVPCRVFIRSIEVRDEKDRRRFEDEVRRSLEEGTHLPIDKLP